MEIKNEKLINWAEAKSILEKRAKERELGYEQKSALEFLRKFCKLSEKDAEQLTAELVKIEKLKPKNIIAIVNNMPSDTDELKLLVPDINLTEDEKKAILTAVKKAL
jgi:DNA-directed RNA polymerase subunit F